MGLRHPPGPLVTLGTILLLAGVTAGCTAINPLPFFSFHRPDVPPPPSEIVVAVERPWEIPAPPPAPSLTTPPPRPPVVSSTPAASPVKKTPPAPVAAPAPPPPPSPLALAMQRAGSYYERGIQALRNGNADQAEWEFDVALETLLTANVSQPPPASLQGTARRGSFPPRDWLPGLAAPPRSLAPAPSLVAPPPAPMPSVQPQPEEPAEEESAAEEPTLEAPALLDPKDVEEMAEAPAEEEPASEEPEAVDSGIPVVVNERVRTLLHYYQTRRSGVVNRAFERASRYLPMMRSVLREKGLPEELVNLAFIESAVNPHATSRAKAAGIWQFIPSTGRLYGLRTSWWLDERRDPEKSTRAAAEYLKTLYGLFESWPLALAAYNVGEGALQRAMQRQRTRDFWSLRLPKETRLFVPAFMAMTLISRDPERFGFTVPPDQPFATEILTLDHPTELTLIAQAAGTSVDHLRELNPELIRGTTPPNVERYALRVPADRAEDILEALARIPPAERVTWITHRVRRGETLRTVARRYRVDQQALAEMNGLGRRRALKAGATLLVPSIAAGRWVARAEETRGRARAARPAAAERHIVQKGDTLWEIARTHGVSLEDLCRWNQLSPEAVLRPGQALTLSAPAPRRTVESPTPGRHYVVKRGDTLWQIAQTHGVSLEDLRRWNRLSQDALLQPGQELRVLAPSEG